MNILFYLHQYPAFGGIETVTTMLASAFAADGHNVAIVSFIHKDGTDLLEQLHPSVKWHELPEASLDSPANLNALKTILADFKPDKVIFQDSYANIQNLLFKAMGKGRPFVAEHSAPSFSLARRMNPLTAIEVAKRIILFFFRPVFVARRFRYESARRKELFDHADHYVILSQNYRDRIEQMVGAERMGKLRVIPNPVAGNFCEVDLTAKKKQMLFVGSLIAMKGVDRLLEIWRELESRHPDWEFVIVGDGVERPRLEAMVTRSGIGRVRFEGFRRDIAQCYRDASIFVMASDFEGWPMALGEAMQQGCVPVVYDSFAAASDIIDDGVNGRVVRHFHHKAYVAAVNELMGNANKRISMAVAARQKSQKYCVENVKNKWYDLLRGT